MKKLFLIIVLTLLLIFSFSCQIIDILFGISQDIKFDSNEFNLSLSYNLASPEGGNKITSFELGKILLISYIDTNSGNLYFKYKKLGEGNINSQFLGDILDGNNNSFFLSTGFDFASQPNPSSYLPVFEKFDETNFYIYFLDSNYFLHKMELKLFYDFNNISYKLLINNSQTYSEAVDINFPQYNNAKLFNLKKSRKIGYMSLYNNTGYIVCWDKEQISYFKKINFTKSEYNLSSILNTTMVEYDNNKIYAACIAFNNLDTKNYLLIYSVDIDTGNCFEIYESKIEDKIASNSSIKMLYIAEKNKLYIAWSYTKDGKDYISISEFDYSTKKLIDRLKIDITGKYLVDIDLKRLFTNGISNSNLFIVYLTNDATNDYQFTNGFIKTNNFSDSSWSLDIIKAFSNNNICIYSNFADSSYPFINYSIYDNSAYSLSYGLSLIY